MKSVVALLVFLNLALWIGVDAFQAPQVSQSVASGNLPRVASLKAEENMPLMQTKPIPGLSKVSEDAEGRPVAPDLLLKEVSRLEDEPEPGNQGSPNMPNGSEAPSRSQPEDRRLNPPETDRAVASGVPDVSVPLMCVRLGLVESVEKVRKLIDGQPLASEIGMSWQEVETTLPPFHWVIIPPQPRPVALKQFRDIQRQGIDSYLVTEGENRNAISLGLFESRAAAISVLEEKKRQNLNAILANFPRNQISYALVFKAEPDLAKDLVQAVKTDYGTDFDFVEINPC